jgi:hypothetical protein
MLVQIVQKKKGTFVTSLILLMIKDIRLSAFIIIALLYSCCRWGVEICHQTRT